MAFTTIIVFWYRQLADICCPNHFAPFIGEFDDVFAEFGRGACKSCVAKLGNPQLDFAN